MTLKNFHPFTSLVTEWCLKQPDLLSFSLRVDDLLGALILVLELRANSQICRIDQVFSLHMVEGVYDQVIWLKLIIDNVERLRNQEENSCPRFPA